MLGNSPKLACASANELCNTMARRLAQREMREMREIAPRRNISMRLARDELYQSVQMQYQALETRLSVVEARLQLASPEQQVRLHR